MKTETADERSARFEREHEERRAREKVMQQREDLQWALAQEEYAARFAEFRHVQADRDAMLEINKLWVAAQERNAAAQEKIAVALEKIAFSLANDEASQDE